MKRFVAILITITMILALPNTTYAAQTLTTQYSINNVTILFSNDTTFSETERQQIINKLVLGETDELTAKFNILCLFGHKYEVGYVTTITHRVSATNPRCLCEYFEIGVCQRCNDSYTQRIGYEYIPCCPED